MVSILPTSGSANGIVSWLWYGMLATAAFAITQGVVNLRTQLERRLEVF